jgi:hypothetical protein
VTFNYSYVTRVVIESEGDSGATITPLGGVPGVKVGERLCAHTLSNLMPSHPR